VKKEGDEKQLKNRIKHYRELKRWSQLELGARAGIAQSAISAYENGEKGMMVETAQKIADALGVKLDKLLEKGERKWK